MTPSSITLKEDVFMPILSKIRNWSGSDLRFDAAVELLNRTAPVLYAQAPWLIPLSATETAIEPNDLLEFTDTYSSTERAVFSVAASLLGGPQVDLSDAVLHLDALTLTNSLAAISAAAGGDYLVAPERDRQTKRASLKMLPNPCPWPAGSFVGDAS